MAGEALLCGTTDMGWWSHVAAFTQNRRHGLIPSDPEKIEETLEQNGRSSIGVKLADERSEDVAIDPAQIAPTVGCDVGGFQPQATSETAHGGLPWQLSSGH